MPGILEVEETEEMFETTENFCIHSNVQTQIVEPRSSREVSRIDARNKNSPKQTHRNETKQPRS